MTDVFDLRLSFYILVGIALLGPMMLMSLDWMIERGIARTWLLRSASGPGAPIGANDFKFMSTFVVVTGLVAVAAQLVLFWGRELPMDLGVHPLEMIAFTIVLLLLVDTNGFFWHRYSHRNGRAYKRFHEGHHRTGGNIRAAVAFHASTVWDYPLHSGIALSLAISLFVVITGRYAMVTIIYAISVYVLGLAAMHSGLRETWPVKLVLWIVLMPMRLVPTAIRCEDHARHHAKASCNYAVFFSHWDRIFGSWEPAPPSPDRR